MKLGSNWVLVEPEDNHEPVAINMDRVDYYHNAGDGIAVVSIGGRERRVRVPCAALHDVTRPQSLLPKKRARVKRAP